MALAGLALAAPCWPSARGDMLCTLSSTVCCASTCSPAEALQPQRCDRDARLLHDLATSDSPLDLKLHFSSDGRMDMPALHAAFSAFTSNADLATVVQLMKKLHDSGLPASKFAGPCTTRMLATQLQEMLQQEREEQEQQQEEGEEEEQQGEQQEQVAACVEMLTALSTYGFRAKHLVPPPLFIPSCAGTGDAALMLRYAALLPHDVRLFNAVIEAFAERGDLEAALSVLASLPAAGYVPDMYTYRTLVDACAQCGQPGVALDVYNSMLVAGTIPNVFVCNSVLNANVKDLHLVRRIYKQMQENGVQPDPPTYHILLKAFAFAASHELVPDLYDEVAGRVRDGSLQIDVFTYSRFIQSFGDAKMWESAMKVKDDMVAVGVTLNQVTWNCLIGACATSGMGGQALRLLHDMITAGCQPNTDTYNTVLHAFAEGGQQETAFQLFEEWKRDGPFSSILIQEFGSEPLVQGLAELETESCKPNLVTYNTMMKACRKAPKDAQALMDEMRSLGFVPDQKSWSTLLDSHGTAGDLEGATRVFEEMEQAGIPHDVVSFTSMIKACVLAKNPDRAFSFFAMMKAAGIRPNVVTYNTLLRAQRKYGQLSEVRRALALYEEMRDAGFAPRDRILKSLLEEWAEGALEIAATNWRSSAGVASSEAADLNEYTELLLQKVAAHATSVDQGNSMTIDLRGLSKAEARLAVLAVLRIVKEKHSATTPVTMDLEIITGAGKQSRSVIQEAVLGVLQDELGLAVVLVDGRTGTSQQLEPVDDTRTPLQERAVYPDATRAEREATANGEGAGSRRIRQQVKVVARRPVNSGRLRVPKDSLNAWLQKGRWKSERRKGQQDFDSMTNVRQQPAEEELVT